MPAPLLLGGLAIVLLCTASLPDGSLRAPHPIFWRASYGCMVVYLCCLLALIALPTPAAVRAAMRDAVDDSLGVAVPAKSYGDDAGACTLTWTNVRGVVLDLFVLPHTFGWVCGSMLLRDVRLAWALSVAFEALELAFTHWQPNFQECWWDHVVVDVLLCNAAGIWLGQWLLRRCGARAFDWLGWGSSADAADGRGGPSGAAATTTTTTVAAPTVAAVVVAAAAHGPVAMRSARRFCAVVLLLCAISLMMLNAFFLKAALWVPSEHALNVWRLLLWYGTAPFAMVEYYALVTATRGHGAALAPKLRKLWRVALCGAVIAAEAALCFKMRADTFAAPFPPAVLVLGAGIGGSTLLWAAALYRRAGWDPKLGVED